MGSCLSAEPPPPPLLGTVQISARPLLCCCPHLWATWEGFVLCAYPQCPFFFWEKTAERAPDTEFQKGCLHSDFWRGTSLAPTAPYIRRTFGNPGVRCQPRVKFVKLPWNFKCFLLRNKWDGENRGVIIRIRSPYKDPLGIWNFKGSLHVFVWTRPSE